MTVNGPRATAAALLLTAVGALTVGCGGGGGDEGTGGAERQAVSERQGAVKTTSAAQEPAKAPKAAEPSREPQSADNAPALAVAGFRVVRKPTKEQLAIAPNSDNSLQSYGEEAQGAGTVEFLSAVRGYFTALGSGDFRGVCPYVAESFAEQLQGFSGQARAQQDKAPLAGCAAIADGISLLSRPGPNKSDAKLTLDANILRIGISDRDETGIMVFRHRGGSSLYSFTMRLEDGRWKAIALVPTPWPGT